MHEIERPLTESALLRTFLEIANCGNLTAAASRLNRSQSAISVQLRKLEDHLNVSLFIRDGKGMSLSKNGEKLLPVAQRVLDELSVLQTLFASPLNGRIRIGIPDDFDEGVLERTLADFSQSNPNVEVLASSGCTAAFPDAVRNAELDMAICSGPEHDLGEALTEQRLVWVSDQAMQLGKTATVPLAVINHGCWMGELPRKTLEQHRRDYKIAFECTGMMSLKAAIRAGFAVGVLFEDNVEPGMRVLSVKDGFPELPKSRRSILVRSDAPTDLTSAMASAIRRSV